MDFGCPDRFLIISIKEYVNCYRFAEGILFVQITIRTIPRVPVKVTKMKMKQRECILMYQLVLVSSHGSFNEVQQNYGPQNLGSGH